MSKKFIIATSPPGKSIPDYMHILSAGLHLAGHKVILLMDHKYEGPKEKNGIRMMRWPNSKPRKLEDALFFFKLCKAEKPDVVLGQFTSTNIVLIVGRLAGVKNRWAYQHTMMHQLALEVKAAKMAKKLRRKRIIIPLFATRMLANSEETRQDVIHHYNFQFEKTSVFHYLIPDKNINQPILTESCREQQILFVSRIDKSKGHIHIIQQVPQIIKEFPKLKFVFIGKGSEKEKLESLVRDLQVENNVTFTGFLPLTKVIEYMRKSLIHVSASEAEAFGLVNVEALCCGTPILAPPVGGIKEIIENGHNGFFYDPRKQGELLEKIQNTLESWSSFSQNARQSFVKRFSANRQNTVLEQVNRLVSLMK